MDFPQRNIYLCKVVQIKPTYILVDFKDTKSICHISEVSDYLVNNLNDYFKLGSCYHFLLLNPDNIDQKYKFSYKKINPKLLRWHYEVIPTISGFNNLYENTMKLARI